MRDISDGMGRAPRLASCGVWLLLTCSGCAGGGESYRLWEMTFATPRGEVVVARISTTELFRGAGEPEVRHRMRPLGSCCAAWSDPHSERIATVEREDRSDVVRVYGSAAALVDEHPNDTWVTGRVRSCPALSPGGRWIAFIDEHGALFTAEVGSEVTSDLVQMCELAPVRAFDMPARSCYWNHWGEVFVGCGGGVYRYAVAERRLDFVDFGHLAGLADQGAVVAQRTDTGVALHRVRDGSALGAITAQQGPLEFVGLSPDGEYAAYFAPPSGSASVFFIYHLHSERVARMAQVGPGWRLGSWHEIAASDARRPRVGVAATVP